MRLELRRSSSYPSSQFYHNTTTPCSPSNLQLAQRGHRARAPFVEPTFSTRKAGSRASSVGMHPEKKQEEKASEEEAPPRPHRWRPAQEDDHDDPLPGSPRNVQHFYSDLEPPTPGPRIRLHRNNQEKNNREANGREVEGVEEGAPLPGWAAKALSPISLLNCVQSAALPVFFGSHHHALLCAPSGCGKGTSALFAIFRELRQEGQRVARRRGEGVMMAYVVPSTRVREPIMRWLQRRLCPLRVKVLDVSQLQLGPREQEEDHKAQEDDGEKEEGNSFVLVVGEVIEWKGLAASSRMPHLKLILIQDVEELCDAQEEEQDSCLQELLASLVSSANNEKTRVVALAGAIDERQVCDSWDHIRRCLQQHAQKEEVVELTFNSRYRYPLLNRQSFVRIAISQNKKDTEKITNEEEREEKERRTTIEKAIAEGLQCACRQLLHAGSSLSSSISPLIVLYYESTNPLAFSAVHTLSALHSNQKEAQRTNMKLNTIIQVHTMKDWEEAISNTEMLHPSRSNGATVLALGSHSFLWASSSKELPMGHQVIVCSVLDERPPTRPEVKHMTAHTERFVMVADDRLCDAFMASMT
ncbi:hypothetical protein QOT17_008063 [Balamuthia mandrillaris]